MLEHVIYVWSIQFSVIGLPKDQNIVVCGTGWGGTVGVKYNFFPAFFLSFFFLSFLLSFLPSFVPSFPFSLLPSFLPAFLLSPFSIENLLGEGKIPLFQHEKHIYIPFLSPFFLSSFSLLPPFFPSSLFSFLPAFNFFSA